MRIAIRPRKKPSQARASSTVEMILTAAARVLATHSLAGFNTNRVAALAGVSVGSLYQYFPNKDALVAVLIAREQERLASDVQQAVLSHLSSSLEAALGALVDVALSYQFDSPVLSAALDHEEQRLPLQAVLAKTQATIGESINLLLRQHAHRLRLVSHKHAAADCMTLVKSMVEASAEDDTMHTIKSRILRALTGYLGVRE